MTDKLRVRQHSPRPEASVYDLLALDMSHIDRPRLDQKDFSCTRTDVLLRFVRSLYMEA